MCSVYYEFMLNVYKIKDFKTREYYFPGFSYCQIGNISSIIGLQIGNVSSPWGGAI